MAVVQTLYSASSRGTSASIELHLSHEYGIVCAAEIRMNHLSTGASGYMACNGM